MLKPIRENWSRQLIRPAVYQAFTRFGFSLAFALLIQHFFGTEIRPLTQYAYAFLAVLFLALGWIAWLRLDGIALPNLMMKRIRFKKKPIFKTYGDIIDHVDENPPVTFEDLEDAEKDICCLFSDAVCCVIFLVLGLIG